MKKLITQLLLPFFLIFSMACNQVESSSQEEEILFLENATDWITYGDGTWQFDQGELLGSIEEGLGFVVTKNTYDDFELTVEFMPDSTINSGVFIHCQSDTLNQEVCYEFNIWDLHPNQDFRTGSIVTRVKPMAKVNTIDQWNTYRIKVEGEDLQVWINDTKTAELKDGSLGKGPIGLQIGGKGKIRFRNVRLKQTDPS